MGRIQNNDNFKFKKSVTQEYKSVFSFVQVFNFLNSKVIFWSIALKEDSSHPIQAQINEFEYIHIVVQLTPQWIKHYHYPNRKPHTRRQSLNISPDSASS